MPLNCQFTQIFILYNPKAFISKLHHSTVQILSIITITLAIPSFFFFLPLFTSISWLFPVLISHNFAQWISLPCQTTLYVCSDPDTKGSSVTLLSLQSTLTLKACHLFLNKRFANHPYLRTTPIPGSKSIYTSFKSDLQSSKSSQNGKKVNNIQKNGQECR